VRVSPLIIVIAVATAAGCGGRTSLTATTTLSASPNGLSPACADVPTAPTVLVALDPGSTPYALAIGGGDLYYGVESTPSPAIYRVSLAGGAPVLFVDGKYDGGAIALDNAYLYFSSDTENILAQPLGGGATRSLDNPPTQTYTETLLTNGGPGVFWGARQFYATGAMTISHWDPASGSAPTTIVTSADLSHFLVDDTHAYFMGYEGAGRAFQSVPISGGAPFSIKSFPASPSDGNVVELLGIDASHLVYTSSVFDGPISRVDKSGDNDTVLVTQASTSGVSFVDDASVYWSGGTEASKVHRAPLSGGATEIIASSPRQYVQAIVTDPCRIVWAVVDPPQIMIRAR